MNKLFLLIFCVDLVIQVNVETKPEGNPFKKKKPGPRTDTALLESLQCIPKLGAVKVKALLVNFHSESTVYPYTRGECIWLHFKF